MAVHEAGLNVDVSEIVRVWSRWRRGMIKQCAVNLGYQMIIIEKLFDKSITVFDDSILMHV